MILVLVLGLLRAGAVERGDRLLISQFGEKVVFTGTVSDDPALSDTNQLSFIIHTNTLNGLPYHAQIAIYTYRLPILRGYQIEASGKVKPALGAAQAEISFPFIQITSKHFSLLDRWQLRFFAADRTAIPEPLASFALGLLVGTRALIPKTFQNQLAAVGLSHLVAVSGYNLTILVSGIRRLFRGSSKFFVFGLSLWLITGFIIVAGASASIMRAIVVSVLVLLAGYYGRQIKPIVLIAVAAVVTAC